MRYTAKREPSYGDERDTRKFYLFPRKLGLFGNYSTEDKEVRFWEWTMVRQRWSSGSWGNLTWSPTNVPQTYPFWYAPLARTGKTTIRYLKNVVCFPYDMYCMVRFMIAARKNP